MSFTIFYYSTNCSILSEFGWKTAIIINIYPYLKPQIIVKYESTHEYCEILTNYI